MDHLSQSRSSVDGYPVFDFLHWMQFKSQYSEQAAEVRQTTTEVGSILKLSNPHQSLSVCLNLRLILLCVIAQLMKQSMS